MIHPWQNSAVAMKVAGRHESESVTHVLLVEDSPADATLTRASLLKASRGCLNVIDVDCISKALDVLEQGAIEVVMLDLNLPDSQGLDTVREICSRYEDLPVVVLSSSDDEELAVESVREGAQDYFIKGRFDPDNMIRALHYAMERKHLECQLKETTRLKEMFIGTVSHELRIPLTAIKEGIRLVHSLALGPLNVDQQETLGVAKNNVDRLYRLINNCLDFQRLQAGRMPFHWMAVDIQDVMEEVIKTMMPLAEQKDLPVRWDCAQSVPLVWGDVDRLVQVVTNLVGNALNFTEQGCVTIQVQSVEQGLRLSVHDTGCGMPSDVLGRIFDRFHQISDSALSRRTGGTGLGLAICKEIIEAHQGRIWAESELSIGTTMTLELPRYTASDDEQKWGHNNE